MVTLKGFKSFSEFTVLYNLLLVDTYLLIKLLMLGRLDKSLVVVVVGDIAIIASSSRGPGGPRELIFS